MSSPAGAIANTGINRPAPEPVDPRGGVSPIGTTSPNSGSSANTQASYGKGAYTSGVNDQASATAYTVQDYDYQGFVSFSGSSPITVTLNQAVRPNFMTTILNSGTGQITLTPDGGLTVNGGVSLTLQRGVGCQVFFGNRAWRAYSGATTFPVVPVNTPAVTGKYLTAYNASTGAFSVNATAGASATVALAKITTLGTDGSLTFVEGILTSKVDPT